MRTAIVTGFEESFSRIGEVTTPIMERYAKQHGFDFLCSRTIPDNITTLPNYWLPILEALRVLKSGYDRVIQLDADQIITNHDYVPPFTGGFHASMDWGSDAVDDSFFSCCGWVAGPESIPMLEWVVENEANYGDEFPAQRPLQNFYKMFLPSWIVIHPRRVFNAVPIEISEYFKEFELVDPWQKGDWLCHVTGVDFETKLSIIKTIIGREGL